MIKDEFVKQNYLSRIFSFYFAPIWQSALTILYLLFFSYFAVFYAGNLWLSLKFIWHTILNSGALLGISYLLWGVVFLVTLIVPFSISLYSILLLYEIWSKDWPKNEKILSTLMIVILVPFIIVIMDEIIRVAASQAVLRSFVVENGLNITGF